MDPWVFQCVFSTVVWLFWQPTIAGYWAQAQLQDHAHLEQWDVTFSVTHNYANRGLLDFFWPKGALFWDSDPESILVVKIASIWYIYIYILPMFGFICKKIHSLRKVVEIVSLSLHHFTWKTNWYSKIDIRDYPQTCFNATNRMAVSESRNELSLEIGVFKLRSFASICIKL